MKFVRFTRHSDGCPIAVNALMVSCVVPRTFTASGDVIVNDGTLVGQGGGEFIHVSESFDHVMAVLAVQ